MYKINITRCKVWVWFELNIEANFWSKVFVIVFCKEQNINSSDIYFKEIKLKQASQKDVCLLQLYKNKTESTLALGVLVAKLCWTSSQLT